MTVVALAGVVLLVGLRHDRSDRVAAAASDAVVQSDAVERRAADEAGGLLEALALAPILGDEGRATDEAAESDSSRTSAPEGATSPVPGSETLRRELTGSSTIGLEGRRPGLREEGSFRRGVRHGDWVIRADDGSILEQGRFEDGLREGPWTSFAGSGFIAAEAYYVAGEMHGPWREYGATGDLVGEGEYRENLRSGRWTLWYSDGSIKERGRYESGLREDLWEFYDDLGRPTLRTGTYRAGIRVD